MIANREINSEFAEVWATIIGEKIDKLQEKQNKIREQCNFLHGEELQRELHRSGLLEAKISAYAEALAVFSSLEEGKCTKKYNEILDQIDKKNKLERMITTHGYGNFICHSFEEAQNNKRKKNIVIINGTDIYLTFKHDGEFGDFACWVEDEFKEDESVYETVLSWIDDIFTKPSEMVEKEIEQGNLLFHAYEKGEITYE